MTWSVLPDIVVVGDTIDEDWGNSVRDALNFLRVHTHLTGIDGDGALLVDLAAGTPSLRRLGSGATRAAPGDHTTH